MKPSQAVIDLSRSWRAGDIEHGEVTIIDDNWQNYDPRTPPKLADAV